MSDMKSADEGVRNRLMRNTIELAGVCQVDELSTPHFRIKSDAEIVIHVMIPTAKQS